MHYLIICFNKCLPKRQVQCHIVPIEHAEVAIIVLQNCGADKNFKSVHLNFKHFFLQQICSWKFWIDGWKSDLLWLKSWQMTTSCDNNIRIKFGAQNQRIEQIFFMTMFIIPDTKMLYQLKYCLLYSFFLCIHYTS